MKVQQGRRIAEARISAKLTQDQLAEHVGVTFQAVSRWESGKTAPRDKNIYKQIADLTGKTVEWLLYGVEATTNDGSLPGLAEVGHLVPSISPNAVVRYIRGDKTAIEGQARAHFPCSRNSFRTMIEDTANDPDLRVGDSVIIDRELKPKPEDFVAVLYNGEPTVRVYMDRDDHVELVPINKSHATIKTKNFESIFIGTITEWSRQRRR